MPLNYVTKVEASSEEPGKHDTEPAADDDKDDDEWAQNLTGDEEDGTSPILIRKSLVLELLAGNNIYIYIPPIKCSIKAVCT